MLGSGTVAGASRLQEGLRPGPRVPELPSRRAVRTSAAGWGPRGVTPLVTHPLTAPRTAPRADRRAPSIAPRAVKPVATATKRAAGSREPAGTDGEGVSSSGSDNPADVAPSPDAVAGAAPDAACEPAPEGPLPPAPGPPRLLVVEAFAGSYPVARAAPALADAGIARVVAYAGIELDFAQCAPSHDEMGIEAAEDYLNLGADEVPGDVTSAAARSAVVDFVRQRLQGGDGADGSGSGALDAVAVFGGPPCQRYSSASADPTRFPLRYKLKEAEVALHEALKVNAAAAAALHDANRQPATKSKRAAKSKVWAAQRDAAEEAAAAARERLAAAQEELSQAENAAREEAAKDAAGLQDSDRLVRSFLHLYKAVEAEAHARGVPCFVVMENPYSSRDRGLWNRPFMKITHLLELPRTSAGDKVHHSSKFRPAECAWLRTTYINYCCFSADAPLKPTILFTNLPAGALRDRRCKSNRPGRAGGPDCRVPAGREHTTVRLTEGAHQRAIWPQEFVAETVRSVVNSAPGERDRLAAAAAAGASDARVAGGEAGAVEMWPLEALVAALEPCAAPDTAKQIAAMHELRARLVRSGRSQREALALEAMEAGAGMLVSSLVAMLAEHAGSDRGLAALGLLDALAAMRRRNALVTSEGLLEALAAIIADDEPGTGPATLAAVLLLATLSTSDITLHKVGRETRQRIRASPGLADAMASHVLRGTPLLDAAVQLLARLSLESGALHPLGEAVQQRHPHLSAVLEAVMPALKQRAGNAARRLLKALQP